MKREFILTHLKNQGAMLHTWMFSWAAFLSYLSISSLEIFKENNLEIATITNLFFPIILFIIVMTIQGKHPTLSATDKDFYPMSKVIVKIMHIVADPKLTTIYLISCLAAAVNEYLMGFNNYLTVIYTTHSLFALTVISFGVVNIYIQIKIRKLLYSLEG